MRIVTKPHKTRNLTLKKADVDVHMIPIVEWLNSYDSIMTSYCCEGFTSKQKKNMYWQKPYVIFTCTEVLDLKRILKTIRPCSITCEIDWFEDMSPIRYVLKFADKEELIDFVKYNVHRSILAGG